MRSPAEKRSVVVERVMRHPPEKIWRALTQPHLIEEWLMKNDFKPVVGHRFNLRRDPEPDVSVVIDCEVKEVDPNKTLSFSWAAFGSETVVTLTLTPTEGGTLVRMEQAGFAPDQRQALMGATSAWHQFLAALDDVLARTD